MDVAAEAQRAHWPKPVRPNPYRKSPSRLPRSRRCREAEFLEIAGLTLIGRRASGLSDKHAPSSDVAKARPGPKPWLDPYRKSPSRLPRSRNRAGCREPSRGDRRARLSDAAPAASDKHRLLHRMSRRRVLGPNRGSTLIESRLRDFREAETGPGVGSRVKEIAGRAYRTPRQRLRISTASFIGCREGAAWVQTVARPLSKVTFATSAKPKPCRVSGAESRRSPGALIGRRASGFG